MRQTLLSTVLSALGCLLPPAAWAQLLPFKHQVEVYRDEAGDVMVFAMRLEQPFLAEEFETSNYLRLTSLDRSSFLIYPRQTKFRQKHAEFYGRLRGQGKAKLSLSYEIVSERLDGSRQVDVKQAEIEIPIPGEETGSEGIYKQWARQQNGHFASLLEYYPDETFFEYVLLQSRDRYGVRPPDFRKPTPSRSQIETDLYHTFSGSLAVQQLLQRQTLDSGPVVGDLNVHISKLEPPALRSLGYEDLLKKKEEEGVQPRVHEISKLIPEDQYFLHMNSMSAAEELMDLSARWGDSLLRLLTVRAREHHLKEKLEDQLCLQRDSLGRLFRDGVVLELAVTGSDMFIAEGADLTVILRLAKPDRFRQAAQKWLADLRQRYPKLAEREFNYRGHRVAARYTSDRMVSSFAVSKGEYAVYSNSHRAIRRVVDTMIGAHPNLHDALDYRYVSTVLPPVNGETSGYLYASEAFLKRLVAPQLKISEKRRLQCFNNLVMLNNASLFYRLEHRESPTSVTELVEGKFVDPDKLVCPHGGAYAFDAERDTCTCSLHNRIKYLTPNVELSVLKVSTAEREEYERYKRRYRRLWGKVFDPLAVRIEVGDRVKLEVAVLPFANSPIYAQLRDWLDHDPRAIGTADVARSAVASLILVPGRDKIGSFLKAVPGVPEVLEADPTLTDLNWIGDRLSLHFCDEDTILEIDPTRLRQLDSFLNASVMQQTVVATALTATSLPMYATIEVKDREKGSRLLEELSSRIFLKSSDALGLPAALDAYRLPDYRGHEVYVLSYQLYAVKLRLHAALVGDQLVVATRPRTLRDSIDASMEDRAEGERPSHLLFRFNRLAIDRLEDDLKVHWAEKARRACHGNIMSIYNLIKLYETPVSEIDKLSDAKYGVTCFCPDGGEYRYDAKRDQVLCSAHGNRRNARQDVLPSGESSFHSFMESLDEIVASLRFDDDALMANVEIVRRKSEGK